MPTPDKAMAIEAMLSEVRGLPTEAQQIASLNRQLKSLYDAFVVMERERDDYMRRGVSLRSALVGIVGVDGRDELEQMEAVMRLMPAPAQDKAATIDAIHALLATLGQELQS